MSATSFYGEEILGPSEEEPEDAGISSLVSARKAVMQRRAAVKEIRAARAAEREMARMRGKSAGMAEYMGGGGGGSGPAVGGDYESWVGEVSRREGLSPVETSNLRRLGMAESGGRNIPQGITDVNTAKGTPAYGPWQVIRPTFDRYASPDCRDWHNPVCNGIASVRYQRARYGGVNRSKGGY